VAKAQGRHFAGTGEQAGIADDGHRAHATEKRSRADGDRFRLATGTWRMTLSLATRRMSEFTQSSGKVAARRTPALTSCA
jgi:hypothetical protein